MLSCELREALEHSTVWPLKCACCQALVHLATSNGGLQAAGYTGGTARDNLEGECVGNPDIWNPIVLRDGLPRRPGEEEKRNAEETGRRPDPSHGEQRRSEKLTQEGTSDEGQGGPETRGVCLVPRGAWLKNVQSCLWSGLKALVGREEGAGVFPVVICGSFCGCQRWGMCYDVARGYDVRSLPRA
ncbi:hypothetical protein NDU88_002287 [Pleurodeles waltl]|uniref:Uncharacterized protein n=1 Tax=Pleurodeles waltl TaxID=8319 RepID=A0AAV7TL69_PLEWA|nr:hypothetical protein NDU88_002287 [Pleurodeles waltl]